MRLLLLLLAVLWAQPALSTPTPTPSPTPSPTPTATPVPTATPTPYPFACPEPFNPYVNDGGIKYPKLGAQLFIPSTGVDLTNVQYGFGIPSTNPNYTATRTYLAATLRRELNQLAAAGVRTVRIFISNLQSGFLNGVVDVARTEESAQIINDDILPVLEAYGIRAIITFRSNSYLWDEVWGNPRWYKQPLGDGYRYALSVEGFHSFADDLVNWENTWITKAESLSNKNVIFYYDVFNEIDWASPNYCLYNTDQRLACCVGNDTTACADCSLVNGTQCSVAGPVNTASGTVVSGVEDRDYMVRKLLRMPALPDAKRGIAILFPCNATNLLSAARTSATYPLQEEVSIAMVDTHSYPMTDTPDPKFECPTQSCATNYPASCDLDVAQKIGLAKLILTTDNLTKYACPVIGEFSIAQCSARQQTVGTLGVWTNNFFDNAKRGGLGVVMHWSPWDRDVQANGKGPVGLRSCTEMNGPGWGMLDSIGFPKKSWDATINIYPNNLLAKSQNVSNWGDVSKWKSYAVGDTDVLDTTVNVRTDTDASGNSFFRMANRNIPAPRVSTAIKTCSPWVRLWYTGTNDKYGNALRKYRASVDAQLRGQINGFVQLSVEGGSGTCTEDNCTTKLVGTPISLPVSLKPEEWTTWSQHVPMNAAGYPFFSISSSATHARVCATSVPKSGCGITPRHVLDIDNLTFNVW